MMHKILNSKYWLFILIVVVLVINYGASIFNKRFDLTAEKRYSISDASKKLLKKLDATVEVEVFLKGNYPAGVNRLKSSINEFLDECKYNADGNLTVIYTNPFANNDDTSNIAYIQDMISRFGVAPIQLENSKDKVGTEESKVLVMPGALVRYKNNSSFVDLRREIGYSSEEEMNNESSNYSVESTLENKFINAIQKLTRTSKPNVAYSIGNGEPQNETTFSLQTTLYRTKDTSARLTNMVTMNLSKWDYIPKEIDVLIINKPSQPFNEYEKLKIDQYILNGGKVFFCIDKLFAEEDSLRRSTNQSFIAFDKELGLDDLLFNYGARINNDLLQDRQCDVMIQKPNNNDPNAKPQIRPFAFYPVMNGTNHPISKNLDGVKLFFPSTIDTINVPNVTKTILLQSSENARVINTPLKVDLDFVNSLDDNKVFNKKNLASAVLLEGNFKSFYENRLSQQLKDSLTKAKQTFTPSSIVKGAVIVVADGDLALNYFTPKGEPLEMGENFYTNHVFSNKEFFINCLEYLTGDKEILKTRGKDFTLRLLDPAKKETMANRWKLLTTLVPIVVILIVGFIYGVWRKKKYTK